MMPITFFNLPETMPSTNAFLSAFWLGSVSTGLAFFGYVYLIEKIGAACYSFSTVFIQKNSNKIDKLVLIGWSIVFSVFIMIPITFFNLPETMPSTNAFLSAFWLGSISTGLAFFGYVYLIEKIGAVKTSTVAYFLPIFGIIWGAIFLKEVISIGIILGCMTILVGVFLATSNKRNKIPGELHAN